MALELDKFASRPLAAVRRLRRSLNRHIRPAPGLDDALYEDVPETALAARALINVGAGNFRHRYWTNVDYQSEWYGGVQGSEFVHYDLTACEPLPFETASVQAVYTSHTVEHVPDAAVQNLINESHRVLVPGGVLRVTCPDAELLMRAVRCGRPEYWTWRDRWFSGPLSTGPSKGEVRLVDYLIREVATSRCRFYKGQKGALNVAEIEELIRTSDDATVLSRIALGVQFDPSAAGDHINWWTIDKLSACARVAGFQTMYRSGRGQSLYRPMTNLQHFDSTQPQNSLYFEALRASD